MDNCLNFKDYFTITIKTVKDSVKYFNLYKIDRLSLYLLSIVNTKLFLNYHFFKDFLKRLS